MWANSTDKIDSTDSTDRKYKADITVPTKQIGPTGQT